MINKNIHTVYSEAKTKTYNIQNNHSNSSPEENAHQECDVSFVYDTFDNLLIKFFHSIKHEMILCLLGQGIY